MKIIVTGSRKNSESDMILVKHVLSNIHEQKGITEIIHGNSIGVDTYAKEWANYFNIKETPYPADWDEYGKAAGPIRNYSMVKNSNADLVLVFPGGKGTQDCKQKALQESKKNGKLMVIEVNNIAVMKRLDSLKKKEE